MVAYTLNIGHRLFPRDATEDLPPRRTPFPVSTRRRHFVPALPGFLWAGPAFGCGSLALSQTFATLPQPTLPRANFAPSHVRRAVWSTPPDTPTRNRQHASTHAPHAARSSPANPFLESPADSGTRAPNLQRLRQAGDARQDLVRNSESTTKCGDYGEESRGDAEVSKIRGESERALRASSLFHSHAQPNPAVPGRSFPAPGAPTGGSPGAAGACAAMHCSRNDGDFPTILSEITRKSRHF